MLCKTVKGVVIRLAYLVQKSWYDMHILYLVFIRVSESHLKLTYSTILGKQ